MNPASGFLTINDITLAIGATATPYIVAFFTILAALVLKDMITSIAKGLSFKIGSKFIEGDHVMIDDEPAIIVKIGLLTSVFGVIKEDKTYCWRYVPNQNISKIKLEKVVMDKGIHDSEKGDKDKKCK